MRAIMKLLYYFIFILMPIPLIANEFTDGHWVDLTHEFSEDTIYWPTSEPLKKTTVFKGRTDAGYFYSAYRFCTSEHGGTHIDAPIHFYKGRNTVDKIPIEQLVGPGIVIRVIEKATQNRNYQFSVKDILAWESIHGKIEEGSILLIDTGSSKYWPDREKYMGTAERGEEAVQKLKFPGIHPAAAKFLTTERKIKAVGLDTPSIDFGGSILYKSHQILFEKNTPGFENVTNLDRLPNKGFTVIALPMKLKGGSGGPLRIVAFIPNK